jgi:hypothetical protein
MAPFWDASLARRTEEARSAWQTRASDALRSHPNYEPACNAILEALDGVQVAIDKFRKSQTEAERALRIVLPPAEPIEPDIDLEAPAPLFDSKDDFVSATRGLIDHKKLNGAAP